MLFEASNSQWYLESGGIKALHGFIGLKAVFSVLKSFANQVLNQISWFPKEFICGCLSGQAGRHPHSGDVCTDLENPDLFGC